MKRITERLKTSVRPAAIHLGVSAAIALLAMAVIYLLWHPGVLAEAQGVSRLVLIMIGVDVVIGPLITLIIFDRKKKWLMLDLTVIAAMQTIALLYGLQAIYGGRPAYVVFNVDRFDVIPVQDLSEDSLTRAPEGMGLSHFGPKWVAAKMPEDAEKRSDIMFSAVQGGADLPQLPEYFVPLEADREQMLRRLHPLDELRKINELDDAAWAKRLADWGGRPETELAYLPMNANAREGAVIVDARTAEIIDVVLLTPSFSPPKQKPVPESSPDAEPPPDGGKDGGEGPRAPDLDQRGSSLG